MTIAASRLVRSASTLRGEGATDGGHILQDALGGDLLGPQSCSQIGLG